MFTMFIKVGRKNVCPENSLKYGEFSTFFTDRLGILRYTDSEVFVELINPSEDELNIEVQEITFLQI